MIKRFLLYFISISALPGFVFWLFYQSDIKSHEHLFESQETAHVNLQSKSIAFHFQNIESDLAILSELHELRKLAENHEDYSPEGLENDFLSISLRKGIYDQIRFINKTGEELLRVNYNNGKPLIVPEDGLQNKAGRYYFKKTMNLNKEEVYVSPIDLNIEKGAVEKPFKPTIRFGTPIFNTEGEKQGVLILNFLARFMIDFFKNTGRDSLGQNHLLNSDGYWISSPNSEDEWGFMLEERKNKAFSNTFPDAWTTILEEETGQFSTHKGLFTFTTFYPEMETQKLKSVLDRSRRVSISGAKADFWKIVSFVPQETLYQALREEAKNLQITLLMLYAFLVLLIGAGVFLFVKIGEQKKKAELLLHQKTRFIQLSQEIAITANEAPTVEEAIQTCLDKVCDYMGWPVGHAYITDSTGKLLPSKLWHVKNPRQFDKFRKITGVTPFDSGVGLPGRVLAHGKPAWITDVTKDSNFPRAKLAKDVGVKAAFGLPVVEGKKIVAVLEFFSEKAIEHDELVLEALSNLAVQLGRVTERKRAEEMLHRYEHIVSSSTDMLALLDKKCIYIAVNKAYLEAFGKTSNELIGHKASEVFGEEFFIKTIKSNAERCLAGKKVNYQSWVEFPVHGQMFMDVTYYPHTDIDNKIVGFVVNGRNITDRKKAEEDLKNSMKQLEEFAFVVSHDLKAPMRAINSLAGWIVEDYKEVLDNKGREWLERLLGRTEHMNNLITGILHYSRIGRIKSTKVTLNSRQVVSEVIESLEHPENITVDIEGELPDIYYDKTQLEQVFQNLIGNAIKHIGKPKGKVVISCRKTGKFHEFCVKDNGVGIEEEHFERIFKIFQRLNQDKESDSTGIGLALVKKIMDNNNGTVWVESKKGEGSSFYFTIPK